MVFVLSEMILGCMKSLDKRGGDILKIHLPIELGKLEMGGVFRSEDY